MSQVRHSIIEEDKPFSLKKVAAVLMLYKCFFVFNITIFECSTWFFESLLLYLFTSNKPSEIPYFLDSKMHFFPGKKNCIKFS